MLCYPKDSGMPVVVSLCMPDHTVVEEINQALYREMNGVKSDGA